MLRSAGQRGASYLAPLVAFLILSSFLPTVAVAQEKLALSGSFYRQDFRMPQGTTIDTPDVYVVVFNNGESAVNVRMNTEAPAGVELLLSESEFRLSPGGQKKVTVAVKVTEVAAPGEYQLRVSASAYSEGTGIRLVGAVGQTAKLTVTGDAATVEVTAVAADGSPLPARVALCREVGGTRVTVGSSEKGSLKMKVAPGEYIAEAYMEGNRIAEESFRIAANETKKITLRAKTVYFESFTVVPNYTTATKKLAFAEILYTVTNLFQPFPQAKVVLKVAKNGSPLDEVSLITLAPLEKGKVELSYNYIPKEGWQKAEYVFKLELLIEGKAYASSKEEVLDLTGEGVGGINWLLIGGIALAVLVLAVVLAFALRRRSY